MVATFLLCLVVMVSSEDCYWNRKCPSLHYSTKTPYDTIRGDIRDYPDPEYCQPVSVWSLHRHGNRNPGTSFTIPMIKLLNEIQVQIVQAFKDGRGQLCAQDVEEIQKWRFNETILAFPLGLTETGYQEMYGIGKRIRQRYPHLVEKVSTSSTDFYFRSSDQHWTKASAVAYVDGLRNNTSLNLTIDWSVEKNHVIEPIKYCYRYEPGPASNDRLGAVEEEQIRNHKESEEYLAVQAAVQKRLGITYQLNSTEVYTIYDICRYYRSWTPNYKDAWCAAFSDDDLEVLGYEDDLRHYFRNGYGSWLSARMAGPLLKDLRERLTAATRGKGQKIVSYFAHNSMTIQSFVALGMYRDKVPLSGARRDPNRLWKSSEIAAFATSLMVVLNKCTYAGHHNYRVQFFVNEKPTELCPLSGCSWQQFQEMVKDFEDDLEFCNPDQS